ncbi:MAG: hypothetical protein IPP37_04565 [Saprospiraceae bacterium]|nr:hypothetical protein [Saprospiraceae bacterium]MBL0081729.1 hypothetical protein [Saprospiraceae bacterium]
MTTKLDNLYNIIKDLPNLKNWYLNGMNLFIKGELFIWSKDVRYKHLLLKLEDKLKDDPKFASYFAENGLFKMKAYKKLQMGFPNFNPCFH